MSQFRTVISNLKKKSLDDAISVGLDILDGDGVLMGRLIPVGEWILSDREKIELIKDWRRRAMKMFFAQFESTYDSSLYYLKNFSIGLDDRVMFLILDENNKFIGHVGISNLNRNSAELDNLMRGAPGGDPRLIYYAEISLLKWCFETFKTSKILAKVISYNWMVIDLHQEVGFVIEKTECLRKVVSDHMINHEVVDEAEANVKYCAITMGILYSRFFKEATC